MKFKNYIVIFFLLFGVSCTVLHKEIATHEDIFPLTIFHINDSHSHLDPTQVKLTLDIDSTLVKQAVIAEIGGFSRLSTLIDSLRKHEKNVLTLHAGDIFQGTLFFTKYSGAADAELLSGMNFDAAVIGNHEFDKGPAALNTFMKKINFPIITANIDASNERIISGSIKPYFIKNFGDEKVTVIGLCLEEIPLVSNPGDKIKFLKLADQAQKYIDILKKAGINKIILLTHIGFEHDILLAQKLSDVDVIVGGHTHSLLGDFNNIGIEAKDKYPVIIKNPEGKNTLVVQAYQWSEALGTLKVNFDKNGEILDFDGNPYIIAGDRYFKVRALKSRENESKDIQFTLDNKKRIKIEEFESGANNGLEIIDDTSNPNDAYDTYKKVYLKIVDKLSGFNNVKIVELDEKIENKLEPYREGVRQLQSSKISTAKNDLIRGRNSGAGPLIAQSMLQKTSAQIAITNAGSIRTNLLAGDITVAKLYELMPFQHTLILINMKGNDVRAVIEDGISFQYDNKKLMPDDYCGYMYVDGIKFKMDISKEKGKRVSDIFVREKSGEWQPINLNAEYKVVVTSFMSGGGDGYYTLKNAPNKYDTGFQGIEVIIDYLNGKTLQNPTEILISTGN